MTQQAMSDRELLEAAAKAAGIELTWERDPAFIQERWKAMVPCGWSGQPTLREWNPLRESGDAFELAVKLGMSIDVESREKSTYAYAGAAPRTYAWEMWGDDKSAATRRAIVRAAAAISRAGEA